MISFFSTDQNKMSDIIDLTDQCELFTLEKQVVDAKVVRVKDGDTILCCFSVFGMQPKKWCIRMLGYDSCEIHTKNEEEKLHGLASTLLLQNKILNKIVNLSFGPSDKYGRLLATVHLDGENINQYMINNSSSVAYGGKHKDKDFNYSCTNKDYLACMQKVRAQRQRNDQ